MGVRFFGGFLIDRSVITRGQLLEALELQEHRNIKFGELAGQKGFLTEEQVEQVNARQRNKDMRFGDLAVEMGLMTEEQVQNVLTQQKNSYLFLGEALLEFGHLTEDVMRRELAFFEGEQSKYMLEEVRVPDGVDGAPVIAACVDLARKMFLRVVGVKIKVGEGFVEKATEDETASLPEDYHLTASVRFISAMPVLFLLSVSSDLAVAIASKILGEDATRESEAIVEDAVCEFCNIICGNVAAKMAQQGIDVEIGPPESHAGMPEASDGRSSVRYPVKVAGGGADLRFLVPSKPLAET